MNKIIDVQLNVQLVYVGLIHEYPYEGPCRFGPWETLTKEFDLMNQGEIFKAWSGGIGGALGSAPGINVMRPIYIQMSDEFIITKEESDKLYATVAEADVYIFAGMRCEGIAKEFAMLSKKPVMGFGMFASTITSAVLLSRGLESYPFMDVPEAMRVLNALKARKALRNTRVLAVTRNNSHYSMGGQDAFLSNDEATKRLGAQFTYFSFHEFIDMMHLNENSNNKTLPGREVYNLTDADMVVVNEEVDQLIADASEVDMDRKFIENSVKATVLAKKLMEHFECNAFTAVCPDGCATRRMNQEQFTFCLSHSLLNTEGIPSACEYDLIGALSISALAALTGCAPYQGNTQPCVYHDGKVMDDFSGISYIPEMDKTQNIYYTGHATPNRYMHGFKGSAMPYAIRPFTNSGWGATLRIDFNNYKGEAVTCMRFDPQCNRIMVGRGVCIGGFGYDTTGCSEGMYFEVESKSDYFHKQCEFGLHMPIVFGDYVEDIKMLGKTLGMEVVIA